MKKLLLTLALCLATLTPVQSAGVLFLAQAPVSAPVNHTNLDGSAVKSATTAGFTINITTTNPNDLIVLAIEINSTTANSVSDTAGLTWTQIGTQTGSTQIYTAFSSGILTADTVTVGFASGSSFYSAAIFGINGVPSSSYFDTNGALPGLTTTSTPLALTTSNANDFLFAAYSLSTSTATAGSGWTMLPGSGTNFFAVEYQIVTATQSALSASLAAGTIHSGKGDAVVSQ